MITLKKHSLFLLCCAAACFALLVPACQPDVNPEPKPAPQTEWISRPEAFQQNYTLDQMVVLSRHNIRSPLTGKGSAISRITPHEWFEWTSRPGELSRKGAILEAQMGQFFGLWMIDEGLWECNAIPSEGQVRFYANSMQRTIATARSFAATFLPMADISVEHHYPVGIMDPVFTPALTRDDDEFVQTATAQAGLQDMPSDQTIKLLERVLDIRHSPAAKGDTSAFCTTDMQLSMVAGDEPRMKGGLHLAMSAADALTLQYYEDPDDRTSAFGKHLTHRQRIDIADLINWYRTVLFGSETVSRNVSAILADTVADELETPGRVFSFLCGHDSNQFSLLTAIDAEETNTPIGGKLVIVKWKGFDGEYYASLDYVYASDSQLRTMEQLDMSNPPQHYSISLRGLDANPDGLYLMSDVISRLRSF